MSSHAKALDKKGKHAHKKGEDNKCTTCGLVMSGGKGLNEKGAKPKLEYSFSKDEGAKNNDSEND